MTSTKRKDDITLSGSSIELRSVLITYIVFLKIFKIFFPDPSERRTSEFDAGLVTFLGHPGHRVT